MERLNERDCILAAISALKKVAQLPGISIPEHFAGTLGWLLLHEAVKESPDEMP